MDDTSCDGACKSIEPDQDRACLERTHVYRLLCPGAGDRSGRVGEYTEVAVRSWECESVVDHFERAKAFFELGNRSVNLKLKRWAFLSALNSLRAVFEITWTALKEGHLKGDADLFDREAGQRVLYFQTVKNLRIQDFHRRAIMLEPGRMETLGTVKMKLGNSPNAAAAVFYNETGPVAVEQKSGRVQQIRPVDWNGFNIFCEEENKYVSISDVVRVHCDSLLAFIKPTILIGTSSNRRRKIKHRVQR